MNVLLAGGGTGGHVYPALAVAEALHRHDPAARVLFVGSRGGMEASLVPAAGVPFVGLAVRAPRSAHAGGAGAGAAGPDAADLGSKLGHHFLAGAACRLGRSLRRALQRLRLTRRRDGPARGPRRATAAQTG